MKTKKAAAVLTPRSAVLPAAMAPVLEPVSQELARSGELVRAVRVGPFKPAAEFLDVEAVRLRITEDQCGQPLPGQVDLVACLRGLPAEQSITYLILEATERQAKCYIDAASQQLLGVLWLPATRAEQ